MTTKVVYFTVGEFLEQAEFSSDDTLDNVRAMFRAAAEAQNGDILKLYNTRGSLISIGPSLPANTADTRYRLEVVSASIPDAVAAKQMGFDINSLTMRMQMLEEKISAHNAEAPNIVLDLKTEVDALHNKLETYDHLSWLGMYKDLSGSLSLDPFWDKTSPPHRSQENVKQLMEEVNQLGDDFVTSEILESLRQLSFDNWPWTDAQMVVLLREMFTDLDLLSKCRIDVPVFLRWLFVVYQTYNDVPFHNFRHAFTVTQMTYGLILLTKLTSKLDCYDVLTLMLSALCHDLDHPGYNNTYQVNARTDLALTYNDISPLENHHCSVAFDILKNPHVNILAQLDNDTYRRVREGMIKCILATDMAKHNDILKTFRTMIPSFDITAKDQKERLMEILIKVADISNEMRPLSVATPWLDCLLAEFFNQSDLEKLEGLPVTPFMDRDKVTKPSAQIGFIKFILLPLVESVAELFPNLASELVSPVEAALDHYVTLQEQMEMERPTDEDGAHSLQQQQQSQQVGAVGSVAPKPSSVDPLGLSTDYKFKVQKIVARPAAK